MIWSWNLCWAILNISSSLILKFLHRTVTRHSLQIHRTTQQYWFEPVMNGRVIKWWAAYYAFSRACCLFIAKFSYIVLWVMLLLKTLFRNENHCFLTPEWWMLGPGMLRTFCCYRDCIGGPVTFSPPWRSHVPIPHRIRLVHNPLGPTIMFLTSVRLWGFRFPVVAVHSCCRLNFMLWVNRTCGCFSSLCLLLCSVLRIGV